MIRIRFILLLTLLASCFLATLAEAQVEPKTQHIVAAWQPSLVTSVCLLLGNQSTGQTLLDDQNVATWIQTGELPPYGEMNRRALRLQSCRVYLCTAEKTSLSDSLWRERLSNQGVHLIETTDTTSNAALLSLSRELCRLFPEKQKEIQHNLYQELERRRTGHRQVNLALHHSE